MEYRLPSVKMTDYSSSSWSITSPLRPRLRQNDWRQGIASDEDCAIGNLVGTGDSAVSSTFG